MASSKNLTVLYYFAFFISSLLYMWTSWFNRYLIDCETLGIEYYFLIFVISFAFLYYSKIYRSVLVNILFNKYVRNFITILHKFVPGDSLLIIGTLCIFYMLIEKNPCILEIVEWDSYSKYSLYFFSLYRCLALTLFLYFNFLVNKTITEYFSQKKKSEYFFYNNSILLSGPVELVGGKIVVWGKVMLGKAGSTLGSAVEFAQNQVPHTPKVVKYIFPTVSLGSTAIWVHNNGISTKAESIKTLRANTTLIEQNMALLKERFNRLRDKYNLDANLNDDQKSYILREMEKIRQDEILAMEILNKSNTSIGKISDIYGFTLGKDNLILEGGILKEKVHSFISTSYQPKNVEHPCLELREVRALISETTNYQFESTQISKLATPISSVLEKILF